MNFFENALREADALLQKVNSAADAAGVDREEFRDVLFGFFAGYVEHRDPSAFEFALEFTKLTLTSRSDA